jgi:hypothetical protein
MLLALASVAWGFGLSLSPFIVEADVRPGVAHGQSLSVTNTTAKPMAVQVYMEDYWYDGSGTVFAPAGTVERSASTFATVQPSTFSLQVGETRPVQLEMRVPSGAEGGYYCVVFFDVAAADGAPGARMGAVVLLDAGGSMKPVLSTGTVEPLTVNDQLQLVVPVTLDGTLHRYVTVKGVLRGAGPDNARVVQRVSSIRSAVLPGQTRAIGLSLANLASGTYRFDGVVVTDDLQPLPVSSHLRIP